MDNTAAPLLVRPFDHGAAVVMYSTTKYIGGHGTSIGGLIIDGGNFDWEAHPKRQPALNTPDPSYHGAVWSQAVKPLGPIAYILKMRVTLLRDLGAAMAPFNAFLFIQGIETLPLRMREHSRNALAAANFLAGRKDVTRVIHPAHHKGWAAERSAQYMPRGQGGLVGFELAGGAEAGRKFINALKMFYHVANIGDARSLAIHPASTTHSQLTESEQAATGVTPGYVRLSIGLEHIDDILGRSVAGAGCREGLTARRDRRCTRRVAWSPAARRASAPAVAARLARDGWRVVVADRDPAGAAPAGGRYAVCDVGDEASVAALVASVTADEQRLDALICNAGFMIRKPIGELSLAEWSSVLATNLTSTFLLVRGCEKLLRRPWSDRDDRLDPRAHVGAEHRILFSLERRAGRVDPCAGDQPGAGGPRQLHQPRLDPDQRARADAMRSTHSIPPGGSAWPRTSLLWSRSWWGRRVASSPASEFVVDGGVTRKMIYPE